MKIKPTDTCYICGKQACSSEHAPARSFFPKSMRTNLIQVPSCEEHNESTSKDDEYVRLIISSHFRNNETGKNQSTVKGIKTIQRSPALSQALLENKLDATIVRKDYSKEHSIAIQIDRERFDNEIRKIAYALYYHKYGRRWNRALNIATYDLFDNNGNVDELGKLMLETKKMQEQIGALEYEGDNSEVFKYVFMETDSPDETILQMMFYEGFELWTFPVFSSTGPVITKQRDDTK